ncbi:putative aldouronate transport system permease protein [Lachnotalea glycerini]|uniref:Carbohydrate ABC transporter permease n=1 Tax=Lachnotalea glycerini TaxID=1763509 RepID=A0A255IMD8_9FIRM|nr:carbohydrate ABC transporter permease [Lachnotalea glycerini]PXV93336.1 putative aldouronate transport system permease protein [Lachnotalea glycerini]RDY31987.1 carbohydrate ABC transporter permease [Lachnotalea glycerini]
MVDSLVVKSGQIKMSTSTKVFNVISYVFVAFMALVCILPFIMMISGSVTSEHAIRFSGYKILPKEFTWEAYSLIFKNPITIFRAYGVSFYITIIGTILGLFLITMTSYVISRKDFKYRNAFSFFFYFTTLFNGGMVCTYIFYIQYLHLKDSLWALILPGMFNVFYLLIMRSFVSAIPVALIESAKIDGAGEFRIFFRIILPLLKSGLATIGLFLALGYWNDWYNAMLYINSDKKYPLQYMLYNMLQQTQALAKIASQAGISVQNLPSNSLKMAMAVVATGPIILLYPFVQKYFVKGITIGSVKG